MGTTAAIIQARMSSTRLPGKVMKPLGGTTVLAQVLKRCQAISGVDVVCVATVAGEEGDPIEKEAAALGCTVVRGSLTDVLDRYVCAARAVDADVILRVTSDCPVIDPELCADVIALLAREKADYACNNMPPSFPHGLDCEAITREWLEKAGREAAAPYEREHVTPYVREHDDASKAVLKGPGGELIKHRWTLDTPDDYAFFQALFEHFPTDNPPWGWRDILRIIEAHPDLPRINAHDVDR